MSNEPTLDGSRAVERVNQPLAAEQQSLTLYAEQVEVSRRRVETALVRATRTTHTREKLIEEDVTHERVEVTRVAIGRVVDAVPPVREDGDTTILPVVEEIVVVERRLVLKEEVHIRRVRVSEKHVETVTIREQEADVSRTELHS